MIIKQLNENNKPRHKALHYGINYLSDSELLALLLRNGVKDKSAIELADDILVENGGLAGLVDLSLEQLMKINGIGIAKATELQACFEILKRMQLIKMMDAPVLNQPSKVIEWLKMYIGFSSQEYMIELFTDNRKRVKGFETIFIGSGNSINISVRELFVHAINNKASSIILAHNHPSGQCNPSINDDITTREIVEASQIIGIPVIDHIIVSGTDYYSYKENKKI